MVTLYDNTLKRYYHNNLFVYCLTLDLNICYICRDFVKLNNKDNLTYLINKVINKKSYELTHRTSTKGVNRKDIERCV